MQFLVLATITFMSNWTNPAIKKAQLEDIHQKSGNATKTSVAETSLKDRESLL